jgi:hypothetical protein
LEGSTVAACREAVVHTPITASLAGGHPVMAGELVDGDLEGDGVDVQRLGGIDPGHRGQEVGEDVVRAQGTQDAEVEDGAEVDVEALGPLPGEDADPAAHALDGGVGQSRFVVRGGQRPHVARRARQPAAENGHLPVRQHPGHGVGLPPVPVRVGQRRDRTGVVEEGVEVGRLALELEQITDVRLPVTVVVDVDGVEDVGPELVEVRPPVRRLQGDVVGDDRHGLGVVGAHEGVEVGAVGHRILRDLGRFTMR